MDQARRLLREAIGDQDAPKARNSDPKSAAADFDNLLRLRLSPQQPSPAPERPPSRAPQQDWPAALDLVRQAAEVVKQSENRIQEQEARIQDLVQRVREELRAAEDRALAAEARAEQAQIQAQARVRAAEMRAQEAEGRADAAQEWLTRIHDTIVSQLSNFPAAQKAA